MGTVGDAAATKAEAPAEAEVPVAAAPASSTNVAAPPSQMLVIDPSRKQVKEHKRRKWHKKTNLGCLACKSKRVKCDLAKPTCQRCQRNARDCVYSKNDTTSSNSSNINRNAKTTTRTSDSSSNGTPSPGDRQPDRARITGTQVLVRPPPRSLSTPHLTPARPGYGLPVSALFHHVAQNWQSIFGMSPSIDVCRLAQSHAHLQHSLLAVAACHLRHVLPDSSSSRIAEHYHQVWALHEYQDAICRASTRRLDASSADALVMTAMIVNTLSFTLPLAEDEDASREPDVAKSWVFDPRDGLHWLSVPMGTKQVLLATSRWRYESAFQKFFEDADYNLIPSGRPSLEHVPDAWLRTFGLSKAQGGGNSRQHTTRNGIDYVEQPWEEYVFADVVDIVADLRHLPPIPENLARYVRFLGWLQPDFRNLLHQQDERALWLCGYWFGLMCRYGDYWTWWVKRRARRDYMATRVLLRQLRLEERPGIEGETWKKMMADLEESCFFPCQDRVVVCLDTSDQET